MRLRRFGAVLLAVPLLAQAPAPSPSGSGGSVPAAGPSAPDSWVPKSNAELILLDKMRGQPTPVSVRAGQSATFGALTISLQSCAVRPPDLPQNAAAFLEVTEDPGKRSVFKGWILSNTPAVSQIEDPVYDLRLVTCR